MMKVIIPFSIFVPGCLCYCLASAKDLWATAACWRASWTSWTACCHHCSNHKLLPNAGLKVHDLWHEEHLRSDIFSESEKYEFALMWFPGVLDIPMISWVVMLVSRLLDYVASIEDEASGGKKHLSGKERERTITGISTPQLSFCFDLLSLLLIRDLWWIEYSCWSVTQVFSGASSITAFSLRTTAGQLKAVAAWIDSTHARSASSSSTTSR